MGICVPVYRRCRFLSLHHSAPQILPACRWSQSWPAGQCWEWSWSCRRFHFAWLLWKLVVLLYLDVSKWSCTNLCLTTLTNMPEKVFSCCCCSFIIYSFKNRQKWKKCNEPVPSFLQFLRLNVAILSNIWNHTSYSTSKYTLKNQIGYSWLPSAFPLPLEDGVLPFRRGKTSR